VLVHLILVREKLRCAAFSVTADEHFGESGFHYGPALLERSKEPRSLGSWRLLANLGCTEFGAGTYVVAASQRFSEIEGTAICGLTRKVTRRYYSRTLIGGSRPRYDSAEILLWRALVVRLRHYAACFNQLLLIIVNG